MNGSTRRSRPPSGPRQAQLGVAQALDIVAQCGGLLEVQVGGSGAHLILERDEVGVQLGLRRIQAVCDTDNRRSYRTMEKLGMIRERLIPRARVVNSRPVDRFVYSILRREWDRRRTVRV